MNAITALVARNSDQVSHNAELAEMVKRAHRSYPTGVTIVSAQTNGAPVGLAVNAFSSVSMEPPTVLVCVNRSSQSHLTLSSAKHLGISILSTTQAGVAATFAKSGGDKFSSIGWHRAAHGAPVIDGAAAAFEIEVVSQIEAGTHSIFVGEVVDVEASEHAPLVYTSGKFYDGGQLISA